MARIDLTNNSDNYTVTDPNGSEVHALGGDDVVSGAGGNDVLYGEGGQNTLYGREGFDWLIGGPELDNLFGGPADDQLWSGTGRDSFIFFDGDGYNDKVMDFEDGVDILSLAYINNLTSMSQIAIYDITSDYDYTTGQWVQDVLPLHAYVNYGTGAFHVMGVTANQLSEYDFYL